MVLGICYKFVRFLFYLTNIITPYKITERNYYPEIDLRMHTMYCGRLELRTWYNAAVISN